MADSKVQAFENDEIIQTYFVKLKVLISKKSIFAQQIGLLDVATYLKDMFEEVFGLSIDDIDLRKSSSLAGFGSFLDDFSKMKIYINDSTKSIDDKCIKDMIAVYDIKLIVTDIMDVQ